MADSLSRRPKCEDDSDGSREDMEEFLDHELGYLGIHYSSVAVCEGRVRVNSGGMRCRGKAFVNAGGGGDGGESSESPGDDFSAGGDGDHGPARILNPESEYSERHQEVATYLATLKRNERYSASEWRKFKKYALWFLVRDGELFRRGSKNVPMRRVVDSEEDRMEIVSSQHDGSGHKGVETTYRRVCAMYWWEGQYAEVKRHCNTCEACQRRANRLHSDSIYSTEPEGLFRKIGIDTVKMPRLDRGKQYLVVARDDLSGWVEARAIKNADSAAVSKFLWEDLICRHGCFGKLVIDGGPENKKHVEALANIYGIQRVQISPYNPGANGMTERGHQPILDALSKLTSGGRKGWSEYLHLVLWSDRTSVRRSTGMTPFQAVYGRSCVLPIESRIATWSTLPWSRVRTRAELLALRSLQLLQRDQDLEEAALRVRRLREWSKEASDLAKGAVDRVYRVNDLVLLHDTRYKDDYSSDRKLGFWWSGPYRVVEANPDRGNYVLAELDGTVLAGTRSGRRMKLYQARYEDSGTRYQEVLDSLDSSGQESSTDAESSEDDAGFKIVIPLRDKIKLPEDSDGEYEGSGGSIEGSVGEEDEE